MKFLFENSKENFILCQFSSYAIALNIKFITFNGRFKQHLMLKRICINAVVKTSFYR